MSFEVCFLTKKITIDKMQLLMTGQGQLIKIISNQIAANLFRIILIFSFITCQKILKFENKPW